MFNFVEGTGQYFISFLYHYGGLIPQEIPGKRGEKDMYIGNLPFHLACCVSQSILIFALFSVSPCV